MANYVHDWQPQRLSGIPGSQFYDEGHAGGNGHNHFGFKTKEQATEFVKYLRGKNVQVTEWAGDPGARVGGHKDPGHYDGRSFDVPASQWSPDRPDSKKEIEGMTQVELWTDDFLASKGVPAGVLFRSKRDSKTYGIAGSGEPITTSVIEPGKPSSPPAAMPPAAMPPATITEQVSRQVTDDWKPAASDAGRSTDPSSQAYWQRQDMKLWAQANPQLAKDTMARTGANPGWLEAPSTTTVTETVTKPAPVASAATPEPAKPEPATPEPAKPEPATPTAVKPPDRGALNGLQPFNFEIHADQPASSGGKTGFIGSYTDADNPLFQQIAKTYGTYGPNNSRDWRDGTLGAPKRGLSIIETRASGPGMEDPKEHAAAADRLYNTLIADPDVKSGKRNLNFFAGHNDVPTGGEMGAAGEKAWNLGVFQALRKKAEAGQNKNFRFFDPIVAGDSDPNANWNRAKTLSDRWKNRNQGGKR